MSALLLFEGLRDSNTSPPIKIKSGSYSFAKPTRLLSADSMSSLRFDPTCQSAVASILVVATSFHNTCALGKVQNQLT